MHPNFSSESPVTACYLKIKIYKIMSVTIILYGCETWSLTLRADGGLDVPRIQQITTERTKL